MSPLLPSHYYYKILVFRVGKFNGEPKESGKDEIYWFAMYVVSSTELRFLSQ